MQNGFTLIEVLIAMFLFAVATIAIVGVSVLVSKTTFKVEKQVVAQAIANDAIEKLHGLPYTKIGIIPSGATGGLKPDGSLEYIQSIQQDQQEYVLITNIFPVDDLANGSVSGILSLANADYVTVRVQVSPTVGGVASGSASSSVVSAATTVANWPPGACSPGEVTCSVEFPALPSTFVFSSSIQIRTFVNSLGLFSKIPDGTGTSDGRFRDNIATRRKLCNLKGYAIAASTNGSASPIDNYQWNGSAFQSTGNTTYIATLTCSSPVSTASCSYMAACPSSGNCADATVPRGYTPSGALYLGQGDPAWVCS